MRNAPPPLEVCSLCVFHRIGGLVFCASPCCTSSTLSRQVVFPDGIPPEANVAPVDVHGIQVPMSAQPEGYDTVLIDLYKKTSE